MKNILRQVGTKFVDGFFILLPVLLVYLMVGQLFELLMTLTTPITDVMPRRLFSEEWVHRLTAAALLIVIFVLVGLAATTKPSRRVGNWIESKLLSRFPPYVVLKNLSKWLAGKDVPAQLQPALLTVSPGTRMLVAIVEELPDGDLTVFAPLAPTPALGMLQIVSSTKVERLESSMTDALGWVLNWGFGTEAMLKSRQAPSHSATTSSGQDTRSDKDA